MNTGTMTRRVGVHKGSRKTGKRWKTETNKHEYPKGPKHKRNVAVE